MSAASDFADTLEPPYYTAIFSSRRTAGDNDYVNMAERMATLAARQIGFLGAESVRVADGFGITISYWVSAKSNAAWKADVEHAARRKWERRGGTNAMKPELQRLSVLMASHRPDIA